MNKTKIILDALKSLKGACCSVLKEYEDVILTDTINIYENQFLKDGKFKKLLENVNIPSSRYINFDMEKSLDYDYFKNIEDQRIKLDIILKTTFFVIKFAKKDSFNHISDGDIIAYAGLINILSTSVSTNLFMNNETEHLIFKPVFDRFINLKSTHNDQMLTYFLLKTLRHEPYDANMSLKNLIGNESLLTYDDIDKKVDTNKIQNIIETSKCSDDVFNDVELYYQFKRLRNKLPISKDDYTSREICKALSAVTLTSADISSHDVYYFVAFTLLYIKSRSKSTLLSVREMFDKIFPDSGNEVFTEALVNISRPIERD